jgi:glycosyltransferase involved in cell wall biosynthesis
MPAHARVDDPVVAIRLSVVIPALNEAKNIPLVLAALPASVEEVIVVDGRSVDGTADAALAARPDARVLRQSRRGKGNALAAGLAAARGEYVVLLDADGSMDPAEVHRFVAALDAGADYVKGTRFRAPGGSADITVVRRLGNAGLNGLTNLLFGTRFTDLCYGYNAVRRDCVAALALPDPHHPAAEAVWGDGFEIETLINIRAATGGLVIREVPSYEHPRRYGESNLNTCRDGLRVLRTIMRERLAGRRRGERPLRRQAVGQVTPPSEDSAQARVA